VDAIRTTEVKLTVKIFSGSEDTAKLGDEDVSELVELGTVVSRAVSRRSNGPLAMQSDLYIQQLECNVPLI
jgi:hypothetical protein